MADNTAAADQASTDASTSGQEPNTTSTDAQAAKSQSDYERMIADLRRENAAARVKAKELDDLKAKLESEKLTETEKLQKQIADLQKAHDQAVAQAQQLKLQSAISSQAAKLGFANPDVAARLLDASAIADDGSNVESLLKDLLKSEPYLAGQQRSTGGGATNMSRSQANANQGITEEYVKDLLAGKFGTDAYAKLTPAQRQQVTDITSKSRYR